MKTRFTIIAAVLLVAACLAGQTANSSGQGVGAKADAAPVGDRPPMYLDIAQEQLTAAIAAYKDGKSDEAKGAIDNVVLYSSKACDASIQSGKKMKNTEISVRKIAEKLHDVQRTVNFDDQPTVQSAADQLEKMRTNLLSHMFSKGKQ